LRRGASFVDADVAVSPDIVGQISAVFRQQPDLATVFGSFDDKPFETNILSQYRNLLHHYIPQTSKEDAVTFWGALQGLHMALQWEH